MVKSKRSQTKRISLFLLLSLIIIAASGVQVLQLTGDLKKENNNQNENHSVKIEQSPHISYGKQHIGNISKLECGWEISNSF